MRPYHFTRPPTVLHRAKLDNLALVPASLLPFKDQWQAIANSHPKGTVLIIMPSVESPQRKLLDKVTATLEKEGHRVTTLPAERFARP